ncbi:transglycosylase SLT domain-containing protein [Marinobacterium rhizophilum]|uniref:Transglycosylase SLT domain-containing protein n=1 Tax=Marinobacterium rhizophilum TaxID=420402 RepID=A0ABY5HLN6_9GAMM|nr:transglycosylase SLT domain-containing protein [Marinobacterium rhizophilum]UTW13302.1 transglycosylase SLT domain-containing protein [Marinobacterium rhizophilum]
MKPLSLMCATLVLGCAVSLPSSAASPSGTDTYARERASYQQAKKAAAAKDWDTFESISAQLRHYPLYPYLEYEQMERRLASASQSQIDQFTATHGDTPLASRLQRSWVNQLARQQAWHGILQAMAKNPLSGTKYQCLELEARLHTGDTTRAYAGAAELWNVGSSQPNSCDALFNSWIKSGQLTSDIALSRFFKAIEAGNDSLAKYVQRYLSQADHKAVSDLFLKVSSDPRLLANPKLLSSGNPLHGRIAAHGIRDLARKDLLQSFDLWLRDRDRLMLDPQRRTTLDRYFGVRMGKNFLPDYEARMARLDPDFQQEEVTEWRIRNALTRLDWPRVQQLISKLPAELQANERWLYWNSVAIDSTGKGSNSPESLARLLGSRNFYSFLAAEMHDRPYDLQDEPGNFDSTQLDRLEQSPAFRRMRELLRLNETYQARSEWNLAQTRLSDNDRHAAAHVASRWDWHDQAIRGAISSKRWNDLSIRFPHPYKALFKQYAADRGINRTWALSIARQESAFQAAVQSGAGARGLMQLMPATATQTAKRYSVPYRNSVDLNDPQTNIALGTAYLAQMLERFNGNRVFATAAYNAGPHRVSRWLEERGDLPLDIWIETIPFDETRNYVQNVLAFGVIYDVRDQQPTRMLSPTESARLALYQSGSAKKL